MSSHIGQLVHATDDRGIRRSADAVTTRYPTARNGRHRATLKHAMRSTGLGVLVVAGVDNQHVEFHAAEYAIAHYAIAR
jgi:hypothetical protein